MKQRISYLILIGVINLFSFIGFAYAGLEETNRWYELGAVKGNWSVEDGVLKVSDIDNTTFYVLTNLPGNSWDIILNFGSKKII